jgi:hypothetical protein
VNFAWRRNILKESNVKPRMDTITHEPLPAALDEDLQIVHATLSVIASDVQALSREAAYAVSAAMDHVHAARSQLSRARTPDKAAVP